MLRVVRALCSGGTLRLRTASVTGGHPMRTQREALEGGVDLLVGTPGRLKELAAAGSLRMDHCRAVVFDEADILLGVCAVLLAAGSRRRRLLPRQGAGAVRGGRLGGCLLACVLTRTSCPALPQAMPTPSLSTWSLWWAPQ